MCKAPVKGLAAQNKKAGETQGFPEIFPAIRPALAAHTHPGGGLSRCFPARYRPAYAEGHPTRKPIRINESAR
jgi:hypothetical protein